MGGLNAWRKFEPDRFTDAEVEKFKTDWRATHPNIVKFWYAVDRAAWTAVRDRGRVVTCGPIAFRSNGAFLQLKLPSGRKIAGDADFFIGVADAPLIPLPAGARSHCKTRLSPVRNLPRPGSAWMPELPTAM